MNRADDCKVNLTKGEAEFFNENGFLIIDQFASTNELRFLLQTHAKILARIIEQTGGTGEGYGPDFFWMHRPELEWPELQTSDCHQNAIRLSAHLLKVDESEIKVGWRIFSKAPHYGPITPWHQDEAYRSFIKGSVNFWISLDVATPESGCMHFIPGSNKGNVVKHRQLDTPGLTLMAEGVDSSTAVACRLTPGGATIHHCRTLHATTANKSTKPRRAFVIVCETPAVESSKELSAATGVSVDAREKELEARKTAKFFTYTQPREG